MNAKEFWFYYREGTEKNCGKNDKARGAGEGDRTLVTCLGSKSSTIELHPHVEYAGILHDKTINVITVFINGAARTFDQPVNITSLISLMELTGKRIAVECNAEIVPRASFNQHMLANGDKLEIVVAVGGG